MTATPVAGSNVDFHFDDDRLEHVVVSYRYGCEKYLEIENDKSKRVKTCR